MIHWAAGLVRRIFGTVVLLAMVICGAEVALRLGELRPSKRLVAGRGPSPLTMLTVPSWTTHHELRPLASLPIRDAKGSPADALHINSLGIRGPEADIPKPADVFRVLCLGDELVFGAMLAEADHFCSELQRKLQQQTRLRIEVWNGGIPGACPLTEFLLLTHRLALLQPDLVLVVVQETDLADDLAYRRYTRTDRHGVPVACRHPSLCRKSRTDLVAACRDEFRLVDVGLRWLGDSWKRKTAFLNSLEETGTLPDLSRLRRDQSAISRTLQPLIPIAAWCRNSYATFCVCDFRRDNAEGQASPAPDSPWTSNLKHLASTEKFLLVELVSSDGVDTSSRNAGWSAAEHREFALQLGQRLLTEMAGPWTSPYFRSEENELAPESRQISPDWRHALSRDALTNHR
jgi:hypothetical protein